MGMPAALRWLRDQFLIIHMSVTNEVSPTLSNPYMVIAFYGAGSAVDVIRVVLHRLRGAQEPVLAG